VSNGEYVHIAPDPLESDGRAVDGVLLKGIRNQIFKSLAELNRQINLKNHFL
jgi:hypothetical protein